MNARARGIGTQAALLALLSSLSLGACASAGLVERDKLKHFAASMAIGAAGAALAREHGADHCQAAGVGFTFSVAIGAGKEYYDLRIKRTRWNWRDLFWDVVGATAGSLLASGCR